MPLPCNPSAACPRKMKQLSIHACNQVCVMPILSDKVLPAAPQNQYTRLPQPPPFFQALSETHGTAWAPLLAEHAVEDNALCALCKTHIHK